MTSRRIIILLIAAILILGTATVMAMEPSVDTNKATPNTSDEEVTVTDLNVNTNNAEAKKAAVEKPVNNNNEKTKAKAEEAKEIVNRKKRSSNDDDDSFDFWFNKPRSRFNRIFKNLFADDEDEGDLFGSVFKDFFGDMNPFGRNRRRGASLFGRNKRRPIASLLSGLFNDDEEDTASNKLLGGWDVEDTPIVREPTNLLNSFSKMFQDFKRRERDEWKETTEAYELRVKLPEGMKKEHVKIEIEKDEDEAGRHTLLIHGKAEKHEEVKKDEPTETQAPQIQDSTKQTEGQAEEAKKTDVVTTPENKEVSATPTKFYKKLDQVSELERRYVIPATVDTNKVSAEIQDNTLVITLSKKAEAIKRTQKVSVDIQ